MTAAKFTFDWYSIGPASGGRGYGLRSWSEGLRLDAAEKEIADKLRLAVSSWSARPSATVAAALIPPGGEGRGRSVLLFATQGAAGAMGSQATANCLLIGPEQIRDFDWRPHGLLPALAQFSPKSGQGPVEVALAPPTTERLPELGAALAWSDLAIVASTGMDGLALALTALDSIDPAAQRERLRGWCAGGLIAGSGPLEARRAYGLLALPEEEIAVVGWVGPTASPSGQGFVLSEEVAPPAPWQAWNLWRSALEKAGRAGKQLAQTPWRAEYAQMTTVVALAEILADGVHGRQAGGLEALAIAASTCKILTSEHEGDARWTKTLGAMDKAVAQVALGAEFKDAGRAAAWLLGLLRTVYPNLRSEPGPAIRRAVEGGVLARLDAAEIQQLVPLGLLEDFADAVALQIPALELDLRLLLLKAAVSDQVTGSRPARQLMADLLMSLSSAPMPASGDLAAVYEKAVQLLREASPAAERPALIAPILTNGDSPMGLSEEARTLAAIIEADLSLSQEERAVVWPGEDLFVDTFTRAVDRAAR